MRDRNEWFKEVERAYSNIELKTVIHSLLAGDGE